MAHYIFDVDGTLTPSRQAIDPQFNSFFCRFIDNHSVSLVTGSDIAKTKEQLGTLIPNRVEYCFNCSGSDIWSGPINVYTNKWEIPFVARTWLKDKLEESSFTLRTGNHIEDRPSLVNFSVVGRNATPNERKLYVEHDKKTNERQIIADLFNKEFINLEAKVGGETGIDIGPKGSNKSQILKWIKDDEIHFFGDAMHPGGNDEPLKIALDDYPKSKCYHVDNWQETASILRGLDKTI